ncbi:MAG: hypothetical protein JO172_11650 [Hyphomicrobiales bacterium]|nr:hypothetical protein [Hyphomicrobiales bacterium]
MKRMAANGRECPRDFRLRLQRIAASRIAAWNTHAFIWGTKRGAAMTLCAFLLGGCADLPLFHEPATFVGFATTPKESVDFVKETRPEKTEFTSVGIEPGHPPDKPRDKEGVKQLQTELEAQRDTGHAILQKLSPETANAQATKADTKAKAKEAARKKPKEQSADKDKMPPASDAARATSPDTPAPQ